MGGEGRLKTNIVAVKHICKLKLGISGMRFLEHMWENRLPTNIFRAGQKKGKLFTEK